MQLLVRCSRLDNRQDCISTNFYERLVISWFFKAFLKQESITLSDCRLSNLYLHNSLIITIISCHRLRRHVRLTATMDIIALQLTAQCFLWTHSWYMNAIHYRVKRILFVGNAVIVRFTNNVNSYSTISQPYGQAHEKFSGVASVHELRCLGKVVQLGVQSYKVTVNFDIYI